MRPRLSPAALAGILAVLAVLLAPFWLNLGQGAPEPPLLARPAGTVCIEPAARMRADHMHLLAAWRTAVRNNTRTYTAASGRTWRISLQETCLSCHTDKAGFCDACHAMHSVSPNCWTCHIAPGSG